MNKGAFFILLVFIFWMTLVWWFYINKIKAVNSEETVSKIVIMGLDEKHHTDIAQNSTNISDHNFPH
jgi:hypothetical protein